MPDAIKLDPKKTAVILVDMINAVAKGDGPPYNAPANRQAVTNQFVKLVAHCRKVGTPLIYITTHRRADNGTHGSGGKRHGRSAGDLVLKVPEGTSVHDMYTEERFADLVVHGDRCLVARAGIGGKGNAKFLSNRRRVPTFAEQGEDGEDRWLRLELRLMADVALVGFPNVGKSTLISRISAAKPRIADYPFTTLEPNLGVVRPDGRGEFVVADIPGLIEGASDGKGLGHRFLRHIERARVLVVMLDLAPTAERPPAGQLAVLERELGAYRPEGPSFGTAPAGTRTCRSRSSNVPGWWSVPGPTWPTRTSTSTATGSRHSPARDSTSSSTAWAMPSTSPGSRT